MGTRLILIHGRAQEGKDADVLKGFWMSALRGGLQKRGLHLSVADSDVKFPYYGQSLFDRVAGKPASKIADIIVRGTGSDRFEAEFILAVLREMAETHGISDAQIESVEPRDVRERGVQNWDWVRRILIAIDRHVPQASAAAIEAATADVYQYLHNPAVAEALDEGVRSAFTADVPTVVVAHSLGTVVAYKVLKEAGASRRWNIPLFVTLGSPLAITAIRKRLQPLQHPPCVARWFNALDPRDVVSLYPLTREHFAIDPEIENKIDVDNSAPNRHSIEGYLGDPEVAARIAGALDAST